MGKYLKVSHFCLWVAAEVHYPWSYFQRWQYAILYSVLSPCRSLKPTSSLVLNLQVWIREMCASHMTAWVINQMYIRCTTHTNYISINIDQLIEKAEAREKERLKAEERKVNTHMIVLYDSKLVCMVRLLNKLSVEEARLCCSLCSNEGRKRRSSPCSRRPTLHCSLQTLGMR